MVKTTFDILGNPFTAENQDAYEGKDILVARKTTYPDGAPTVFFEIGFASEGLLHTQMGEIFMLTDCQCWWPMPTPIFSHG
jgi:hypothetical protein